MRILHTLGRADHGFPVRRRPIDGGLLGNFCFALRLRDGGCSATALVVPKGLWKATTTAAAAAPTVLHASTAAVVARRAHAGARDGGVEVGLAVAACV